MARCADPGSYQRGQLDHGSSAGEVAMFGSGAGARSPCRSMANLGVGPQGRRALPLTTAFHVLLQRSSAQRVQFSWPPAGSLHVRRRADLVTASVQKLLSCDTWPPARMPIDGGRGRRMRLDDRGGGSTGWSRVGRSRQRANSYSPRHLGGDHGSRTRRERARCSSPDEPPGRCSRDACPLTTTSREVGELAPSSC